MSKVYFKCLRQKNNFAQKPCTARVSTAYLYCLNAHPFARSVSRAGGDGDAVISGRLQITPVGIRDRLYQNDRIGSCSVDRRIGNGIADLQISDAANIVFRAAVMPADADVAVPSGGGAIVSQSLCHSGVGLTLPYLHIDIQRWDLQRADTAILTLHAVNAGVGRHARFD